MKGPYKITSYQRPEKGKMFKCWQPPPAVLDFHISTGSTLHCPNCNGIPSNAPAKAADHCPSTCGWHGWNSQLLALFSTSLNYWNHINSQPAAVISPSLSFPLSLSLTFNKETNPQKVKKVWKFGIPLQPLAKRTFTVKPFSSSRKTWILKDFFFLIFSKSSFNTPLLSLGHFSLWVQIA